jgi:hypothetical protein
VIIELGDTPPNQPHKGESSTHSNNNKNLKKQTVKEPAKKSINQETSQPIQLELDLNGTIHSA